MPIQIEPHAEGIVIAVRAQPGAKKNGITGEHDGALKVSVTQAPEKGKANKAIVEVLARQLGLKKSQVSLLSGQTTQQKRFLLSGVDEAEVRNMLKALDQS